MFCEFIVDLEENLFEKLSKSANFEDLGNGRKGAILVDSQEDLIPIVRTTTIYQNRASNFLPIHHYIIRKIKDQFKSLSLELGTSPAQLEFNNALMEIYDDNYRSMRFHSDQALDLDDDSYICIFSCYDRTPKHFRKLKVQDKTTKNNSEIVLNHNSVVLWSTTTNKEYLHKIILENKSNARWSGITFRLSKTYIKFITDKPYFNGDPTMELILANEDEKKHFYKHRSLENSNVGCQYPQINYTISVSDTLPIDYIKLEE
ncbi:Hypothetical protein HVR_LOCUS1241 [uncultured virus]|nr:Hypothetical protein HVR_LOCUS1241 [uncultured virus]